MKCQSSCSFGKCADAVQPDVCITWLCVLKAKLSFSCCIYLSHGEKRDFVTGFTLKKNGNESGSLVHECLQNVTKTA